MKKITTLIFTLLIAYNSYCQTNDYSNPQILFSVNVVPDWVVNEVNYTELPKPIYDENTGYGRCMNNNLRWCAANISCSVGFMFYKYIYMTVWHRDCAKHLNQTIIPPIKTL